MPNMRWVMSIYIGLNAPAVRKGHDDYTWCDVNHVSPQIMKAVTMRRILFCLELVINLMRVCFRFSYTTGFGKSFGWISRVNLGTYAGGFKAVVEQKPHILTSAPGTKNSSNSPGFENLNRSRRQICEENQDGWWPFRSFHFPCLGNGW